MLGAKRWRVHFVMPSAYTLSTLPEPNNPTVQLREVPAKTWSVLSYSGFNTEVGMQQRTDELVAWLAAQKNKHHRQPATGALQPTLDFAHVSPQRNHAGNPITRGQFTPVLALR